MSKGLHRTRRTNAFTLIELLVVVAIVSLLLSILLPSLQAAREQSKLVVCKSNLRNIWTGIFNYSLENRDRVPFLEDINIKVPGNPDTGVNADPFNPEYPTTVGVALRRYVNEKSWVCPSAVNGFPRKLGSSGWTMTYTFSTAGAIGEGVPYDADPARGSNLDPALTNYRHFDGRPLKLLDGRRYVPSGMNENRKGRWNVRFPIIRDMYLDEKPLGGFVYPHKGLLKVRNDLGNLRDQHDINGNVQGNRSKRGYLELHADEDQVEILFTRTWLQHQPGY